ncbi:MAG: hypothetical protein E7289_04950 [Lachnospiraceae bacterium]|nr:hypothetical protein [Lachnospiraceae bacterium]
MTAIKVVTIVILSIGIIYFVMMAIAIGLLTFSIVGAKVEVHNDIAEYNDYIHNSSEEVYSRCNGEMFDVFPDTITENMNVEEFQFMYYNPWDAQYITYMTVDYDEEAYTDEIARLQSIGQGEYQDIYSVTDEPSGYDLVAIYPDECYGFVYAMIPEGADEDSTVITYVGINFCNYFLDVDIHDYLPKEYLLKGFDATSDNPYRKLKMGK